VPNTEATTADGSEACEAWTLAAQGTRMRYPAANRDLQSNTAKAAGDGAQKSKERASKVRFAQRR